MKVDRDLMRLRRMLNNYYWMRFKEVNWLDMGKKKRRQRYVNKRLSREVIG